MTFPRREPHPGRSVLAAAKPVELPNVIAPSDADSRDVLIALERVRLDIDFLEHLLDEAAGRSVAGTVTCIRQRLDQAIEQLGVKMYRDATPDRLVREDLDGR